MKNGDTFEMKFERTLHTGGDGLWTDVAKDVQVTKFELSINSFEADDVDITDNADVWGELRVYFDTASWNVTDDGLIYTDEAFLDELRGYLELNGFDDSDVGYSEQGMQDREYVSLDVGKEFINSWVLQDWFKTPLPGI